MHEELPVESMEFTLFGLRPEPTSRLADAQSRPDQPPRRRRSRRLFALELLEEKKTERESIESGSAKPHALNEHVWAATEPGRHL